MVDSSLRDTSGSTFVKRSSVDFPIEVYTCNDTVGVTNYVFQYKTIQQMNIVMERII